MNKLEEKANYNHMRKYIIFTNVASELIHELQKERGYSCGFIASKGQ